MSWTWIAPAVVLAVHDGLLAEHGGAAGVRDMGLLESALARPAQLAAYGEPDACDLATAYAFGIARDHPFVDGNKRTAYVVCLLFLRLHGLRLDASGPERVLVFEGLGKGTVDQPALAAWLRSHAREAGPKT